MKELKAMEGFSVTLGKGNEKMLLVFISMMLNGDTLQLACSCSRIEARVCPSCFSVTKYVLILPGDNSFLTLHQ